MIAVPISPYPSTGIFSSRGNRVMIFEIPHNRGIQEDITKGIWMTLNGGKLLLSPGTTDLTSDGFDFVEADI